MEGDKITDFVRISQRVHPEGVHLDVSYDTFFGVSAKNDRDQVFDFVEGVRGHTVSGRRKCDK